MEAQDTIWKRNENVSVAVLNFQSNFSNLEAEDLKGLKDSDKMLPRLGAW